MIILFTGDEGQILQVFLIVLFFWGKKIHVPVFCEPITKSDRF